MYIDIEEMLTEAGALRKRADEIERMARDICLHPKQSLVIKYGSDTGNYDPSSDCYWVNVYCPLCKSGWRFEGDQTAYRFPKSVSKENV